MDSYIPPNRFPPTVHFCIPENKREKVADNVNGHSAKRTEAASNFHSVNEQSDSSSQTKSFISSPDPDIQYRKAKPLMTTASVDQASTVPINANETKSQLRAELLSLARIPESKYLRGFPPVSVADTNKPRQNNLKRYAELVDIFLNKYDLFNDTEFEQSLQLKQISLTIFDPKNSMRSRPECLLETIVSYVFADDPVLKNTSFCGEHGYSLSYSDEDILKVYEPILEKTKTFDGIDVKYTENNKPIIQQQATRGCTYAAAAMLMHENHRTPSVHYLRTTNLGNSGSIIKSLSREGLQTIESICEGLEDLTQAMGKYGPAITAVQTGNGGHSVIVDRIEKNEVRIRDPYHGWEVNIDKDAFLRSWCNTTTIIQVMNEKELKDLQ